MAERIEKKKAAPARTEEVVEEAPATSKSGEAIKADLDKLWTRSTACSKKCGGIRKVLCAERRRVTTLRGRL